MSTNISKKKRDDLLDKIKQIRAFIAAAPQDENTGNLLSYLSELEKDVNGKKYGLVFEEHREEIDEVLDTHTPVLTEDADLFIDHGGQMNFLLEGDNLAALKLLEKTHRGKIDLIYIDPPYNRGKTDFVYDDDFVVNEDTFRHSKWISFMKSRLEAAKRLLTEAGLVFISIDDNEVAALKLLCDEVFGADFFINLFVWQRNSSAKTEKGKFTVNTEYVLLYAKSGAYTLNSAYKPLSDASQKLFKFDDNDGRGKYQTVSLQKPRDPGPETTYDYAYASRTTERQQLYRKGDVEAANSIPAKYIVGYHDIPDKDLTPYPLISTSISAKDVDYDLIVYDTYDYLDKLIGFKLSDIFYAVFYQYYEATSDECALRLAKYFKYGTDKEREIWMLRYGFSFEETELVSECIDFIDETEIKFNDRINALNEAQLQVIEQYVHE